MVDGLAVGPFLCLAGLYYNNLKGKEGEKKERILFSIIM